MGLAFNLVGFSCLSASIKSKDPRYTPMTNVFMFHFSGSDTYAGTASLQPSAYLNNYALTFVYVCVFVRVCMCIGVYIYAHTIDM